MSVNIVGKIVGQLAGARAGQAAAKAVDTAVDSPGAALASDVEKLGLSYAKTAAALELTKLGVEPTLVGLATYLDNQIGKAIQSSTLSEGAKTSVETVVNDLFALIEPKLPTVSL